MDWPTFRHDHQRTGRAHGVGDIRTPSVIWRQPVGGRRALIELSTQAGELKTLVPFGKEVDPGKFAAVISEWDGAYRTLDLAGDGKLVRVRESTNIRFARFLPGAPGFQKFVMEDGMSVKTRPDGPRRPVARGSLYRYDHGREELVWQTGPEEQCEKPLCAVADMDGDGAPDIAVSTWWRVMVFDGATGRKKMECRWHKGRNYGHFAVVNLDDDPFPECVVLADFMIHLDVLDNDGKQLSLKWRKEVDFTLFQKRKAVRLGPHPIASLRGDGRKQIALNVFNDTGDNRWHVLALDALTGEAVADLPDRFLHGVSDSAGTLLLSEAHGLSVPVTGKLFAGRWANGRLIEHPLPVEGRWLTREETQLPPTQASCAADGYRTTLVTDLDGNGHGEAWAVTPRDEDSGERLAAFEMSAAGAWREVARCDLPAKVRASVAATKPTERGLTTGVLLQLDAPASQDAALALRGVRAVVRSVSSPPLPPDVPVVGRMQRGLPPVIAVAAAGEVVAIAPPQKTSEAPRELWRAPGRSQTTDMQRFMGLEMADMNGDGVAEVLAADQTRQGQAALAAYDGSGHKCWSHTFERFPGSSPHWNTGGLLLWTAGSFSKPGAVDVLAMLRRAAMHTDESCVIESATGREAWWQGDLLERGCGGAPVALRDANGDGRDNIVGQYPDIHFVLSGATGKSLSAAAFPKELGGGVYYAMPTIFDANGDGKPETLLGRCTYSLALFSHDGKVLWHSDYLDGTVSAPALADLNGDSKLAIGAAAYRGGFRCYDAATGATRWSLPTAQSATDPVAADVDGDGREEFIFGVGHELWAVGEAGSKPRVVWKLALPAVIHPPIAADVNGDGRLDILCLATDGFLYAVGNTK